MGDNNFNEAQLDSGNGELTERVDDGERCTWPLPRIAPPAAQVAKAVDGVELLEPASPQTQPRRPSTKIHTTVDALGKPTGFPPTPWQAHDLRGPDVLLNNTPAQTILAEKAYDAQVGLLNRC